MDEDQHRQVVLRGGRAPDVEGQAIFAAQRRVQRLTNRVVKAVVGPWSVNAAHLQAGVAKSGGAALAHPGGGLCRRLPAQGPHGGLGVGNALPGIGAAGGAVVRAAHHAVAGFAQFGRRTARATTRRGHHSGKTGCAPAQALCKMGHVVCLLRGFQEWGGPAERITLAPGTDLGAHCGNARPTTHYRNHTKTVTSEHHPRVNPETGACP